MTVNTINDSEIYYIFIVVRISQKKGEIQPFILSIYDHWGYD